VYQRLPSWVLGFHGTDEETVARIVSGADVVKPSSNAWDWLGDGAYFWENDPQRALDFSKQRMAWKKVKDKKPAVVGAIIDLGFCLNLFEQPALQQLKAAYDDLFADFQAMGKELPKNGVDKHDLWSRQLDRAVVEQLHYLRDFGGLASYQTVRSPFLEGDPLYDHTTFQQKNHIQIAVCDQSCIKGYFLPRA